MIDPTDAASRFEPCAAFRAGDDPLVCACGWLEDDHVRDDHLRVGVVVALGRCRPSVAAFERRAS